MEIFSEVLWRIACIKAGEVDFLTSKEEMKLYATALYDAMVWAKKQGERK